MPTCILQGAFADMACATGTVVYQLYVQRHGFVLFEDARHCAENAMLGKVLDYNSYFRGRRRLLQSRVKARVPATRGEGCINL